MAKHITTGLSSRKRLAGKYNLYCCKQAVDATAIAKRIEDLTCAKCIAALKKERGIICDSGHLILANSAFCNVCTMDLRMEVEQLEQNSHTSLEMCACCSKKLDQWSIRNHTNTVLGVWAVCNNCKPVLIDLFVANNIGNSAIEAAAKVTAAKLALKQRESQIAKILEDRRKQLLVK